MKRILIVTLILGALVISACMPVPTPTPAAAGIPNPASVNCIKQGGVLDIRKEANGEVGYCKFADGSECEEWALMRGECKSGQLAAPAAPAPQPTGKK